MKLIKKVHSFEGFSVFFLDICHRYDIRLTFKINFKDEKKFNDPKHARSFCPYGLWTRKEIRAIQCCILQYGESF